MLDRKEPFEAGCPVPDHPCPLREELESLREAVSRLRELSRKDPLTGLYNFRHLTETLESEMERTRRTGLPVSLVMADLDRFKRINDTYGHEAGNRALVHTTVLWKRFLRRIDILCRYGGEEFVAILPGTRLGQAAVAAERLRAGLEDHPVSLDGDRIVLTASFGVDCYLGAENLTVREFLVRADQGLLKAKEGGRNRVCLDESKLAAAPTTEVSPEERDALIAGNSPEE